MGHHSTGYGHSCKWIGFDLYQIHWIYDKYYPGDRLRYPQRITRTTDEAGARRFCKKWGLVLPEKVWK